MGLHKQYTLQMNPEIWNSATKYFPKNLLKCKIYKNPLISVLEASYSILKMKQ